MSSKTDALTAIQVVARSLAELNENVMFVGGVVPALLVDDPAAPAPRPTDDVDIVADVVSYPDYVRLTERIRALGFAEDTSDGAPTCRWLVDAVRVDLMSTGRHPGPANRWYAEAFARAATVQLSQGTTVRMITAPYFLATKLEAFSDGRRGDIFASHDIEDIVAVIDGRMTIVDEVLSAPSSVADYLRDAFRRLFADRDFADAVAGHLPGDSASQARLPLVLARVRAIAQLS